jgi:hypothetical protein
MVFEKEREYVLLKGYQENINTRRFLVQIPIVILTQMKEIVLL